LLTRVYGSNVWKEIGTRSRKFVIVSLPLEKPKSMLLEKDCGINKLTRAAKIPFLCKIVEFRRGSCRIEFTFSVDSTPAPTLASVVDRMRFVVNARNYFQTRRPLGSLQKADGVALGTMISKRTCRVKNKHAVTIKTHRLAEGGGEGMTFDEVWGTPRHFRDVLLTCKAMQEFGRENEWFVPMINGMLTGRIRPAPPNATVLSDVNAALGRKFGNYLLPSLAVNITPAAGVHDWIGKYPAVSEIAREIRWFEPFVTEISKSLLQVRTRDASE